jgi:hypothetical protein
MKGRAYTPVCTRGEWVVWQCGVHVDPGKADNSVAFVCAHSASRAEPQLVGGPLTKFVPGHGHNNGHDHWHLLPLHIGLCLTAPTPTPTQGWTNL